MNQKSGAEKMKIVQATMEHLEEICKITEQAKAQIRRLGFDQWQKGSPSREGWVQDIINGNAWAAIEGERVLGAFAFFLMPDPSYDEIDGMWLTKDTSNYAAMHRVCVSDACKGKGVAGKLFEAAFAMADAAGKLSVRIDTHPENLPMQRALEKAGFERCGEIHLKGGAEDGALRIGFEKCKTLESKAVQEQEEILRGDSLEMEEQNE